MTEHKVVRYKSRLPEEKQRTELKQNIKIQVGYRRLLY